MLMITILIVMLLKVNVDWSHMVGFPCSLLVKFCPTCHCGNIVLKANIVFLVLYANIEVNRLDDTFDNVFARR